MVFNIKTFKDIINITVKLECPNCESKKFTVGKDSKGVFTCCKCGGIYGLQHFKVITLWCLNE